MDVLAILLLGLSGLGIWSGTTGRNPLDVVKAVLTGGALPAADTWLPIGTVTLGKAVNGGGTITEGKLTLNGARAAIVGYANAQIGKWYVWDTPTSPGSDNYASAKTFDCSGLSMAAYAQVGIHLPHYTEDQRKMGSPVLYENAQPGDLLFWPGLQHVAIYVGNGMLIEAPHTGAQVHKIPVYNTTTVTARSYLTGVAEPK